MCLEDLEFGCGKGRERVMEDPKYFGFTLPDFSDSPAGRELYLQATPAAIGTLLYIAYETHRLFEARKPKGEHFDPLQLLELVSTTDRPAQACSGVAVDAVREQTTGKGFEIDLTAFLPSDHRRLQ